MPAWKQASATAATTASPKEAVAPSSLFFMTGLGACDGTIVLLAANGMLSSWVGATLTGLTVIGGAGAWIAAREAFGGRAWRRSDRLVLLAIALTTSLATVAAAWLGDWVGNSVRLLVLPRAAGLVLLLVALEVGGLRLPRLKGMPLPAVTLAAGILVEGVAQWSP